MGQADAACNRLIAGFDNSTPTVFDNAATPFARLRSPESTAAHGRPVHRRDLQLRSEPSAGEAPIFRKGSRQVKIKVVVHEAEEGGFWAEVPALPGCATEGETMEELLANLREAIEGCLSVDVAHERTRDEGRVLEIAI